ncbi:hypothetical protein BC937DRAFT_90805 [Endogone sp. FLAS-F59071]|nr:hypothetical protein BC937DRAFT_90805 [Endogone sp. FLAS-F59071]|eukprot:RUS16789.1 hypothetical protein BC937DRAFT_90805 [Endogone sp. FLAS-F59071]
MASSSTHDIELHTFEQAHDPPTASVGFSASTSNKRKAASAVSEMRPKKPKKTAGVESTSCSTTTTTTAATSGRWSNDEKQAMLNALVEMIPTPIDWRSISADMSGRSANQCNDQWRKSMKKELEKIYTKM